METDAEIIAQALNMRANFIETGNVLFSASDADKRNKTINCSSRIERRNVVQVNVLTQEQKELVKRLRELELSTLSLHST